MPKDQDFNDYVVNDVMAGFGVTSRSMFGGWGLYQNGIIFGMIVDGELYFKVNDDNIKDYKDKGSHPFVYEGKNKPVTMSYWTVPEDVLENKDELLRWIGKSINAKTEK